MRRFYRVTNCETGSSELVLANGHVDALSFYRKCNDDAKNANLQCDDVFVYICFGRYAFTKLSELPDYTIFYLAKNGPDAVPIYKISTMANGMVRCRYVYDTIRPDSYFKSSTKVAIIGKEEQQCLESRME